MATKKPTLRPLNPLAVCIALSLGTAQFGAFASEPARDALPRGGKITGGDASILQRDAALVIEQKSQKLIADWDSFDIGRDASVTFIQPNADASALNRIHSVNPTQIFGQLNANGKIYLVNAQGIIFGRDAQVNVGSLVASTLNLSDQDYLNNTLTFNGSNDSSIGRIENYGQLAAAVGGTVALLSEQVINHGTITSPSGQIYLAAGQTVSLDFDTSTGLSIDVSAGSLNALVENHQAVIAAGGQVILTARGVDALTQSVVNNHGLIEASSLTEQGGRIILEGDSISLTASSEINATGATGGGDILIGGDWQGGANAERRVFDDPNAIRQAITVTMADGATIDASATDNGDGGTVVLWSDVSNPNAITAASGSIYAKGGANSGNGGQIETSGYLLEITGAGVNAGSKTGRGGLWLLDPSDSSINQGVADTYVTTLNTGTSVVNEVTGTISIADNVTISKTAGGGTDLTLKATAAISFGSDVTIESNAGELNVTLWTDSDDTYDDGQILINPNSRITTNGGDVIFGGGSDINFGSARSMSDGIVLSSARIDAQGGNVSFRGDSFMGNGIRLYQSTVTTTGFGGIEIDASQGLALHSSNLSSENGSINIRGSNFSGTAIDINGSVAVTTAGFGTITLFSSGQIYLFSLGTVTIGGANAKGLVQIITNSINLGSSQGDLEIDTSGDLRLWPTMASFTADLSTERLVISSRVNDVQIGKSGNTKVITLENAIDVTGTVQIWGSTINANADVTSDASQTFTGAMVLGADVSLTGTSISASSTVNLNSHNLTVANSANGSVTGIISGSGTLTKSAAGTLILSGANTYTGATTISNGVLVLANNTPTTASSVFAGAGSLRIESADDSFTSTFEVDSDWSFASDLGGLTFGKASNTADLTIISAITIAGPISVYGGTIAINQNLDTTGGGLDGDVTITGSGSITLADSKTITTNGSDVTLISNNGLSSGGGIVLGASAGITTTGAAGSGNISLGSASNYAIGNIQAISTAAYGGVMLTNTNTLNAGSGLVRLYGKATGTASSFGVYANNVTITGSDITLIGEGSAANTSGGDSGVALYNASSLTASGALTITGTSLGTNGASANIGLTIFSTTTPVPVLKTTGTGAMTLTGVSGSGNAGSTMGIYAISGDIQATGGGNISLIGSSSSTGQSGSGVYIVGEATRIATISASGAGNINITGTGSLTGTNNANGVWIRGNYSTASLTTESGSITITGTKGGGTNAYGIVASTQVASGQPAPLTLFGGANQTGAISFNADEVRFLSTNGTANNQINTSGTVTFAPRSASFSEAQNYPYSNVAINSRIGGLTIGKPSNAADITISSAQSVAGAINVYGGEISVNANLISTVIDQNILLQGARISQAAGVTVQTDGGDITYTVTDSPWTAAADNAIAIGSASGAQAVIDAQGGDISVSSSLALIGFNNSAADADIALNIANAAIRTNAAGSISLSGDAYNNASTTADYVWGTVLRADTIIQTNSGAINISGRGGVSYANARGIASNNTNLQVLSSSGTITFTDTKPDGNTSYSGMYINPSVANPIKIGAGGIGSTVVASSSTLIFNVDSITFSDYETILDTSGNVIIQPVGDDFIGNTYLGQLSLTNINDFTVGKSLTGADGAGDSSVVMRAITIAGSASIYAGKVTILDNVVVGDFTAASSGDFILTGSLDADNVTVNSSAGKVSFFDPVGLDSASATLFVSAGDDVFFDALEHYNSITVNSTGGAVLFTAAIGDTAPANTFRVNADGNVTFSSTLNSSDVAVDSQSGRILFSGAVGDKTTIDDLAVTSFARVFFDGSVDALNINVESDDDTVTFARSVGLRIRPQTLVINGEGDVRFSAELEARDITINSRAGRVSVNGNLGSATAANDLIINAAGNVVFIGSVDANTIAINASAGSVDFLGIVGRLFGPDSISVNAVGDITFHSSLDTDALAISSSNSVNFAGAVGSYYAPNTLSVLATGNIVFDDSVEADALAVNSVSGSITFIGAVGGTAQLDTLTASANGNIDFANSVDADAVAINAINGSVSFLGAVGADFISTSVAVSAYGDVQFGSSLDTTSVSVIATNGSASFYGAIGGVYAPTTAQLSSYGDLTLAGNIDAGTVALTSVMGGIDVGGTVGVYEIMTDLQASAYGSVIFRNGLDAYAVDVTAVNGGVTIVGLIGAVTAPDTLDISSAGSVVINNAVAATDVEITSTLGSVDFLAAVGAVRPLGDLIVNASGAVQFVGTVDASTVTVTSNLGAVDFISAVGSNYAPDSLEVQAQGAVAFVGSVDAYSLDVTSTFSTVNFVSAVGSSLSMASTVAIQAGSTVSFGSTFDGHTVTISSIFGSVDFVGAVGSIYEPDTLVVNASNSVAFNSTLDAYDINITSTNSGVDFVGAVGASYEPDRLLVSSNTQINFFSSLDGVAIQLNSANAGISVVGAVGSNYAPTTLNAAASSNIVFSDRLDVSNELRATSSNGAVTFNGRMGTNYAPALLVINAFNDVALNQVDAFDINITSTQGLVDFYGPVGSVSGANELIVSAAGDIGAYVSLDADVISFSSTSGSVMLAAGPIGDLYASSEVTLTAAGDINLSQVVADNLTLTAGATITDASGNVLEVQNLRILDGDVTLNNTNHQVGTLAATADSLVFVNSTALTIGSVDTTNGITATGIISVKTTSGDLTISQPLATSDTSAIAIVLQAGSTRAAGNELGGDILFTGTPAVTVGSGGRALVYTGSIANSTGVDALVGIGSGNFRYNANHTTDFTSGSWTDIASTGLVAVYREQPTVTINDMTLVMTYGDNLPSVVAAGIVNGDGSLYAISNPSYSTSNHLNTNSSGYVIDTAYAQLGYNLIGISSGRLVVAPKALTVSGLTAASKTYDGQLTVIMTGTAGLTGGGSSGNDGLYQSGDVVSLTGTAAAAFADENAGINKAVVLSGLTLTGTDATNYRLNTSGLSATITPITLNFSAGRNYNGNRDLTGVVTLIGLLGSETLTYSGATVNDKHVATSAKFIDAITLADGSNGGLASNYALPVLNANTAPVTITPATLSVSLTNTGVSKVYDGTTAAPSDFSPSYQVTSGLVAGDSAVILDHSAIAFNDANVANANMLTVSGLSIRAITGSANSQASDYVLDSTSKQVAASISKANLIVTADNQTRVYGEANPLFSQTISGFVAGETISSAGISGTAVGSATADTSTAVGNNFVITAGLGNLTAANYQFSAVNGVLTITARPLAVTISALDKVYDGNTVAQLSFNDNRINNDSISFSYSAAFADKQVGTDKVVQLADLVLTGDAAANYTIAEVTPVALSASISRLDSVIWVGAAEGDWFDPSNWAGGALPDLSNVANVVIPEGVTVTFNNTSDAVSIDRLDSSGSLVQTQGVLNIGSGNLNVAEYEQSGGTTNVAGNFTVTDDFNQAGTGIITVAGDMAITDTSGGVVVGNITSSGSLSVTSSAGAITQAAGTQLDITGAANFIASNGQTPPRYFAVVLNGAENRFTQPVTIIGYNFSMPTIEYRDADYWLKLFAQLATDLDKPAAAEHFLGDTVAIDAAVSRASSAELVMPN